MTVAETPSEYSPLMEQRADDTTRGTDKRWTLNNNHLTYHGGTAHFNVHDETGADRPRNAIAISNTKIELEPKPSGLRAFAKLSARKKYSLILITTSTFWASVAYSLLGPFFPTEAAKKRMSIATISLVFGVFELVIFVTAPFFGNYLSRLGPRFVFIAGIFVGGTCNILFGTLGDCPSGTPFIAMSFIIRSAEAVGFSAFLTSSFAIVCSEFKDNVAFTFGVLQTGSGLGFMLGPTLGGSFFELGGFGLPFYFAGAAVLLNGIAVYRFLPYVDEEELIAQRKGSILDLLRSPMVVISVLSVLVGMGGITTYDSTLAKHLEPLGLSVGVVGVLFGSMSTIYTIMSSIWGYLSDSKDIQAPLIVGGHFVFGLGFLVIGPSVLLPFIPFNLITVITGLVFIGVSFGCSLIPTMKCMVIGAIEMGFEDNFDTYARVSGLFNSVQTLGGFIGPMSIGYLVEKFGYPLAYTVLAMSSIFMMVVSAVFFSFRTVKRRRKRRSYNNERKKGITPTSRVPESESNVPKEEYSVPSYGNANGHPIHINLKQSLTISISSR